jgi:hypothetical protein
VADFKQTSAIGPGPLGARCRLVTYPESTHLVLLAPRSCPNADVDEFALLLQPIKDTRRNYGVALESSYSFDSRSVFVGLSEVQPLVGLNSTVDPSRCCHLKQRFTGPNSKQIACEDAYAWINGRRVPTAEDGLKIRAFVKKARGAVENRRARMEQERLERGVRYDEPSVNRSSVPAHACENESLTSLDETGKKGNRYEGSNQIKILTRPKAPTADRVEPTSPGTNSG